MTLTGVSFGGDSAIRWIEDAPSDVECIEVAAAGLFARPTPYLAWLAGRYPLIVRASELSIGTPGPLLQARLDRLTAVSALPSCRTVVCPLGFSESDDLRLGTILPIGHTSEMLDVAAEHVAQVSERCARPVLIEPVTAPLRVPGTMAESAFLVELCQRARCRLLIDVTTQVIASANHGVDPRRWLREIPPDLIGAARISGCAFREGRRRQALRGDFPHAAWALMRDLVSRARPDVLILGIREQADLAAHSRDFRRLRELGGTVSAAGRETTTPHIERAAPVPTRRPVVPEEPLPFERPEASVQVDPDASLFVLDMEGVLFSASRHELSLLNPPATLVWCLVEDGLSIGEITSIYRKTFGLSSDEAARHVAAILRQWFGLGYISRPAVTTAPDIPFTTALAWLLVNPRLRRQFRQQPREVAAALGVRPDDLDAFALLDCDELDDQAREVEDARSARLNPTGAEPCPPVHAQPWPDTLRDPIAATPPGRNYRLVDTTFSVRISSRDVASRIHQALAHLECPGGSTDVNIELRQAESGRWMVTNRDRPAEFCRSADQIVPGVKQWLREAAVEQHPFLIRVHAGVVGFGSGCVLLPASAGSGKTTLTAALVHSGATYFSDEVAPLSHDTLLVRPVPLALTIKDGSVQVLRPLYPEIANLPVHVREDFVRVRYLRPPPASLPGVDRACSVKWIVFPRYDPALETRLIPLERPAALRRLLDEAVVDFERLDRRQTEQLVTWMRGVDCYQLPMSSLDAAVALVRGLAG